MSQSQNTRHLPPYLALAACWLALLLLAGPALGADLESAYGAHLGGNMHGAIERLNRGLASGMLSKEQKADALAFRGAAFLRLGRPNLADKDLTASLKLMPDDAPVLVLRSVARRRQGRLGRAEADLARALKVLPGFAAAWRQRGLLYKAQGHYAKAVAAYGRALELEPDLLAAQNGLAWLLATCPDPKLRNGDQALMLVRRAIARDNGHWLLDTQAAALAENGHFTRAAKVQEQALEEAERQGATLAVIKAYQKHLESYYLGRPWREAGR